VSSVVNLQFEFAASRKQIKEGKRRRVSPGLRRGRQIGTPRAAEETPRRSSVSRFGGGGGVARAYRHRAHSFYAIEAAARRWIRRHPRQVFVWRGWPPQWAKWDIAWWLLDEGVVRPLSARCAVRSVRDERVAYGEDCVVLWVYQDKGDMGYIGVCAEGGWGC
jgi:hypothetical protein